MNKDLECPYCDRWNEICHDDGFGYEEDVAHEMDCAHCGKKFVFFTSISYNYSPHKADCLNGAPHDFSDWRQVSFSGDKHLWRRRCQGCDHHEQEFRDAIKKPNHNQEGAKG